MLGHPSKPELLAYAEGLVDGRGISAATARHITSCPVCQIIIPTLEKKPI